MESSMSTVTPRTALPELAAAQAQKHVTHNEALIQLDALLNARILDRNLVAPPANPANGDAYLVAANPTGVWAGQSGKIAFAVDGGWRFYAPFQGLSAFIADESAMLVYTANGWADWSSIVNLQNVPLLGVNTAADATNKFALKANAALFAALEAANGGTGDMRIVNSKSAAVKTASVLFQDNFSGRAEFGLMGDDNFHVKVSADGAIWNEAIVINRTNGNIGIGTTNPGSILELKSSTPFITLNGTDNTQAKGIQFQTNGNTQGSITDNISSGELKLQSGTPGFGGFITFNLDGTESMRIQANTGNIGIGTTNPAGKLDVNDDHIRVRTAKTPATSATAGNQGDIAWDTNYIYVCVAANSWKRAALASW